MIARPLLPLLALSALTLSACGRSHGGPADAPRGSARPAPYATGRAPEVSVSSNYSGAEASTSAPPPMAPVPTAAAEAGAAADRAYEPAPKKDRPGLGTEWGETRESRVSSAPFERESWSTPLSVTSFFYNDAEGVRAMMGSDRHHWDTRGAGVSAARGAITIRLMDGSGAPLPTYASGDRSYVVGENGDRYTIRIDNQTGARFEAVATVDGLDVIDGQPGSFEKRGYLIGPWSSVEIDGFRQSSDAVAAFRFGRVRDSYAAKRGSDRNVGVIGVALFHERGSQWPWTSRELERRNDADAFPGRFAPPPRY